MATRRAVARTLEGVPEPVKADRFTWCPLCGDERAVPQLQRWPNGTVGCARCFDRILPARERRPGENDERYRARMRRRRDARWTVVTVAVAAAALLVGATVLFDSDGPTRDEPFCGGATGRALDACIDQTLDGEGGDARTGGS